jgi:hypothetical protein
MAKKVIKHPLISINGVDLTNRITQITIDTSTDEVDSTTFDSDYKQTEAGMMDASVNIDTVQDYAKGSVDATLWPLAQEGKAFLVKILPEKGTGEPSEDNPCYQMAGKLFSYSPLSASPGELSTSSPSIKNVTNLGIQRALKKEEVESQKTALENAIK